MNIHQMKNSIEVTKNAFERSFSNDSLYNKQTQDEHHLQLIIGALELAAGMKVLDLGTGSGYLAFEIARNHPQARITGLDIVEKTLAINTKRAQDEGLTNLFFQSYDGMMFPFEDGEFDLVVSRYALHHFPMISDTFKEISRVLKPEGKLFISDPTPNSNDAERFVDAYMKMKKDGHIKFYTEDEFKELAQAVGLSFINCFKTSIRFPRKRIEAREFPKIIASYHREITEGYHIEVTEDELYITEEVNNLLFYHRSNPSCDRTP